MHMSDAGTSLKVVDGHPQYKVCRLCKHQEYEGDEIDIKTWLRNHTGKGHICNSPKSKNIGTLPKETNCKHFKGSHYG